MRYEEAFAIIRQFQVAPPVKVVSLARALGAEVYRTKEWPDEVSGMICKDRKRGGSREFVIYVNAAHHVNRRRFTIAHEIAHIVLHEDLVGNGITTDGLYRSGFSSLVETRANKLAADILMPVHLVDAEIAQGANTVEKLAGIFRVSNSAMSIRLGIPFGPWSESPGWTPPSGANQVSQETSWVDS